MMSIMEAMVVDLPEPVGPVTSTRPECLRVISRRTGGSFNCSMDGMVFGMTRMAQPTEPR